MRATRRCAIWCGRARSRQERSTAPPASVGKVPVAHGKRPVDAGQAWTQKYLNWIRIPVHCEQPALEATVKHYREEVEHIAERMAKLEQAIDEVVKQAPAEIRVVIEALQALRG